MAGALATAYQVGASRTEFVAATEIVRCSGRRWRATTSISVQIAVSVNGTRVAAKTCTNVAWPGITRILVPTDFSGAADAALEYAFVLAERFGASLHLLHVLDDPYSTEDTSAKATAAEAARIRSAMLNDARREMAQQRERVLGTCAIEAEVVFGHGARTIADYADRRAMNLIVIGTAGRTGFAHLLLGSVAERVVRESPCPVLTVRPQDAPGLAS